MSIEVRMRVEVPGFSVEAECSVANGITAFAGPSGSGKSLTLAAIAGLVRPVSGHIAIDGQHVFDSSTNIHVRTQDRHIGMVFQLPSLLSHRSALDNVALAVVNEKKSVRREKAREWLHRVGADRLTSRDTRELSGGERQRVALARALVNGSRVLLLDEPFSALDLESRAELRALVIDLVQQENLTAVLVSHDIEDIAEMASTVVLFEPGSTVGTYLIDRSSPESVIKILSRRAV